MSQGMKLLSFTAPNKEPVEKKDDIIGKKIPCFPYYNPGYYLKKNYFGVGIIKGKGLFKGGIIF